MNLKNADGTANLKNIQAHTANLKAKYAQGMANYEKNTGKPFHQAQEEAQISNKAKHEAEINLEGGIGEDSKVNQAGEKKEL